MRAIQVGTDSNRSLSWSEVADPTPGPGEIRVRARATAVNRADLLQRLGMYPPPPGASDILGLEAAGEVEAVGPGVRRWQTGDRVCCLLSGGGYAERIVLPAGHALPIPADMSWVDAAAIPEVFATAWLNLFLEAKLTPGQRVLIHAGASGVGTAAIQLCRAFDARCMVTAGSADKLARCAELGAETGHNRHDGSFLEPVMAWSEDRGVDVILDVSGGAYLTDNVSSLALDGRLVVIGLLGGVTGTLSVAQLLMKRLHIIGSTLRSRSVDAKSRILASMEARVWPLLADGSLRPIVHTTLPITRAAEAHDLLRANANVGKVVLEIP